MRSRRLLTALASAAVLALAACGGGDATGSDGSDGSDGQTDAGGEGTAALVAEAGAVTIEGTDTLKWSSETIEASAGPLEVTVVCGGGVNHTFLIEETGDELVAECDAGASATGTTADLASGTFTYYCDVPGHRAAGMEGTLTVSG